MASASDRVYEEARREILSGRRVEGTYLREEELARAAGVSRTPAREALRRLEAEGLVTIFMNKGALVTRWGDKELNDVYELRVLLEGYAACRAAARTTTDALLLLDDLSSGMDEAAWDQHDMGRLTELNLRFHREIHTLADNQMLASAITRVIEAPLVHHTFERYTAEELRRSLAHHHELVAALTAGDGDWAEAVMRSHVHAARASLRREIVEIGTSADQARPTADAEADSQKC
jgi:DNA-binding GntR family transcriptional regulator